MSFLGNVFGGFSNGMQSGNALGALGGIFGGFAAGAQEADERNWIQSQNQRMLSQQFEYNKALQSMAQAFNANEAAKAREWNSLPNQLKRAAEAGVNPMAALGIGQGQSQISASSSPSSVGLPSVSAAPTGTLDLANLSQALQLSSSARNVEKHTSRYDEEIDATIKKLYACQRYE